MSYLPDLANGRHQECTPASYDAGESGKGFFPAARHQGTLQARAESNQAGDSCPGRYFGGNYEV